MILYVRCRVTLPLTVHCPILFLSIPTLGVITGHVGLQTCSWSIFSTLIATLFALKVADMLSSFDRGSEDRAGRYSQCASSNMASRGPSVRHDASHGFSATKRRAVLHGDRGFARSLCTLMGRRGSFCRAT